MKHSREERRNRRKLHEEMNRVPSPLIETDEEIIRKLLSKQPYNSDDITKCAEELFIKHSLEFKKQFRFIESVDKIEKILEELDISANRRYFFVFCKRECCYVLFCLIMDKFKNHKILYKDPFTNAIDEQLERRIRSKLNPVEFVVHSQEQKYEETEPMYGPMCLRNIKIMLDNLQSNNKHHVEIFKNLKFCTPIDINNDRCSRIMVLTNQIARNDGFLSKLREFIDKLPPNFDADEESEVEEFESSIEKHYPVEMENVHILLQVIADTVTGMEILETLKNICDILGLNFDKIQSFFPQNKNKSECDQDKTEIADASVDVSPELVSSQMPLEQPNRDEIRQNELKSDDEDVDLKLKINAEGDKLNKSLTQFPSTEENESVSELNS